MRLDPNDPPDIVTFLGVRFRRMGGARKYYLSQATTNDGRKGAKGLHVAIWEHFSGQRVPDGHEINHKDSDTFNCEFENLECLPRSVHRRLPRPNMRSDRVLAHLAEIRPLAAEWHRSEAGIAWHKEHGKDSLAKAHEARKHTAARPGGVCEYCGSGFEFKTRTKRFCGFLCQGRAKKGFIVRTEAACQRCAASFVPAISTSKFCSTECGQAVYQARYQPKRSARRRKGLQPDG